MRHHWCAPLVLLLPLILPRDLQAQRIAPYPAVSLEATAGAGALVGGDFLHRTALALDLTLGVRARESARGALLVAASASLQAPWGNAIACPGGGGECTGEHPLFTAVAALAGWEHATSRTMAVRVLGGPALYHAMADSFGDDDAVTTLGLQLRGDVAVRMRSRLALVFSARGAYLPDLEGDAVGLGSLSAGVRLR